MTRRFPHLTKPGRIGSMVVKNRMVVAAMGVNLGGADATCTERIIAYHQRQAQGGAGLIITGVATVAWPDGAPIPNPIGLSDDRFILGLTQLARAVQRHGAKIAVQLHHGGINAAQDVREGRPLWVPSLPPPPGPSDRPSDMGEGMLPEEIQAFAGGPKPELHVVSKDDIAWLVGRYAEAAARAQRAGIDGVELHAGHGYILSGFLSPAMNRRDDEYGGSVENRARFLLEVIAAIRASTGPGFPLWVKIDCGEYGKREGTSLADALQTARLIEAAGADAITASAYHDTSHGALHSESNIPHTPERMLADAAAIKGAVSIPVIASGRVEPGSANRHIRRGHFDFLGMGRKILADPDLPNKVIAGTPQQVRPCVYCYCCVSQIYKVEPVKCAVNPETAREWELQPPAPASPGDTSPGDNALDRNAHGDTSPGDNALDRNAHGDTSPSDNALDRNAHGDTSPSGNTPDTPPGNNAPDNTALGHNTPDTPPGNNASSNNAPSNNSPARNAQRVAVIGGGPAGMEVARRLHLRGFAVDLLESGRQLGGTLQFASVAYPPNQRLLDWLRLQIAESGVEVHLNTAASAKRLKKLGVDQVVVATGARRDALALPGAERNFVFSGDEMRALVQGTPCPSLARKVPLLSRWLVNLAAKTGITGHPGLLRQLSKLWLPLGRNVCIIGAELVGLELAEFLAERGRKVTVIDNPAEVGRGLYLVRRLRLLDELRRLGVDLIRQAGDIAIGDQQVSYTNPNGQRRGVVANHVIVARGATGDDSLAQQLRDQGFAVHSIGDCNGVGYIEGAMEAAAELVAKL